MELLIDLFGYLSIVVHGLTILSQSMALGGALFLAFLARPLASQLGRAGQGVAAGTARIAGYAALGLVVSEAATVALQAAVLVDTVGLSLRQVMGADFAAAGLVKTVAAAAMATVLLSVKERTPILPLLALTVIELAAATLTTHAAARLDGRGALLVVEGLHQLGAAIWVGGIPAFLLTLSRIKDGAAFRLVGARFSRMSMVGVACILVSGVTMSVIYIRSVDGFYGTAFGVMVGAKIAMFLMLLALGGMNFLLVERLRADPSTSVNRLRRFAEVEFGIGIAIFFAAASLTSVPPAVDLTRDRVTWQEIVERNTPIWPRLNSPDHDLLALHPRFRRAAAPQRRRHRVVRIQPPLGRTDRRPRGCPRAGQSRRAAHRATLAVGVSGAGGVPVLPLRPGNLADGRYWFPGEFPRRGSGAAPVFRCADHRVHVL